MARCGNYSADDDVGETLRPGDDLARLIRRDQDEAPRFKRNLLDADPDHAAAADRKVDLFLA